MKHKKQKPKKTGRITSVSVSRLYNTGNYTNVRYDLSAEVPKGTSALETLRQMGYILEALRPISIPDCLQQLKRARRLKLSERSEYEKNHYPDWLKAEAEYRNKLSERDIAVGLLDSMGGTSSSRDAKDSWDSGDVPW